MPCREKKTVLINKEQYCHYMPTSVCCIRRIIWLNRNFSGGANGTESVAIVVADFKSQNNKHICSFNLKVCIHFRFCLPQYVSWQILWLVLLSLMSLRYNLYLIVPWYITTNDYVHFIFSILFVFKGFLWVKTVS